MKSVAAVMSAMRAYVTNPDNIVAELSKMSHEELVIFTMQLLDLSLSNEKEQNAAGMSLSTAWRRADAAGIDSSSSMLLEAAGEGICAVSQLSVSGQVTRGGGAAAVIVAGRHVARGAWEDSDDD